MPPSTFPRIDINTPSNLDEVTSSLLTAAESHLPLALERDGLSGKHEEAVCRRVLEQWKDGAASRIRENVTVNGVSWKTATKRGSRDGETGVAWGGLDSTHANHSFDLHTFFALPLAQNTTRSTHSSRQKSTTSHRPSTCSWRKQ